MKRPPLKPAPPSEDQLLDAKIGVALMHAAQYLLRHFSGNTSQLLGTHDPSLEIIGKDPLHGNSFNSGMNALAVYALMQAGLSIDDQRIKRNSPMMGRLIDGMKILPATEGPAVYARGIRATALALYDRPEDRAALQADVTYLLRAHSQGGYSYGGFNPPRTPAWDNSNSQYGLLGVWSGAEVGIEVPGEYWADVETHWNTSQNSDGTWSYQPQEPAALGITAAGIASLLVAHQWTEFPSFRGDVGLDPFTPSLRSALQYWEAGDNYLQFGISHYGPGYAIYGIERVGLACGFKFFGTHEWYRELARQLVARQHADGSWRGDLRGQEQQDEPAWHDLLDTAYITIALARARHPVLMNKLRFDHAPGMNNRYWDNRPNDMNHLATWSGHELERPLNWQIVSLERDWMDWMDSPVLYFACHRPLQFSDDDYAKFRKYVDNGGMIFTQADGDSESFTRFITEFAHKLFPNYEMVDVPPNHPIYSVNYKLDGYPPLKMVSNGSRILLLHSLKDISRYWETRDDKLHKRLFQAGLNIALYAGGKRDLKNKLVTTYVPEPKPLAKDALRIKLLRLSYNGNWDPEPAAWDRCRRVFQNATGCAIDLDTVALKDLQPGTAPLAHLTGNVAYEITAAESTALRGYVEAGGVVLIDCCGGSGRFADSIRNSLARTFGQSRLQQISRHHPVLQAGPPGMSDLSKPKFRQIILDKLGPRFAAGLEMLSVGKGHLIFSPHDITTGLLGTDTWEIWGFAPDFCQRVVQNVVFWTIDGQPDGE